MWAEDLVAAFGYTPQYHNATPEYYVPLLQAAGLQIENLQEWKGKLEFTDVGALVYYLKAIPWTIPGFSVQTHLKTLFKLEEKLQRDGSLVFTGHLYLIEAVK